MEKGLEAKIYQFNFMKIGVIGDVMLDRTEQAIKSNRKNPENENVPILLAREEFYLGGCGNVSTNLTSLGAKVDLFGIIGKDLYGHQIKEMCKKDGIDIKYLIEDKKPTILKSRRFLNGNYQYRSDLGEINKKYEKNLEKLDKKNQSKIILGLKNEISKYNAIVLSDYNKRMFTHDFTQKIILMANSQNIPIICDAKPENIDYFKFCTAICPNKEEAIKMSGKKELFDMGKTIQERINSKYVIITCGKEGAFVYNGKDSVMLKTEAKTIREVTGAGDTLTSIVALGLSSGMNISESTRLANVGAGIVVEKLGTSVITQQELITRARKGL